MLNVDLQDVVKKIKAYLSVSKDFSDVEVIIEEDEDTYALLYIKGQALYVEVNLEDVKTGIRGTISKEPVYHVGYYKTQHGGYWEPDDVVDVEIDQCKTVAQVCIAMVTFCYHERLQGAVEAEMYAEDEERIGHTIDEERNLG